MGGRTTRVPYPHSTATAMLSSAPWFAPSRRRGRTVLAFAACALCAVAPPAAAQEGIEVFEAYAPRVFKVEVLEAQSSTPYVVGTAFVAAAGGYLVQLLPEVGRGPLLVMTERLRDFESIDAQLRAPGFSPDALLEELLYGMPFTRLEVSPVGFECWCNELRVVSAIATLPKPDIAHLLSSGDVLEVACEYCKREFRIPPARLQGLLDES
jgi:hypothetical protein